MLFASFVLQMSLKKEKERDLKSEKGKQEKDKSGSPETKRVPRPAGGKPCVPSSADGGNLIDQIYSSFKNIESNAHTVALALHRQQSKSRLRILCSKICLKALINCVRHYLCLLLPQDPSKSVIKQKVHPQV